MKRLSILALLICPMVSAFSQDMLSVTGGYSTAIIKDTDVNATGVKITGHYEFLPKDMKWSFGISTGYINVKATDDEAGIDYNVQDFPLYASPKYYLGSGKFRGFAKVSIGAHTTIVKKTGNTLDEEDRDLGFVLGGGAGATYWVGEKIFLVADYELLRLSNGYLKNSLLNTFSAGLGIKLSK